MSAKAEMIEVGMASAAMSVERKFHRKRKTMMAASRPPTTRCYSMACKEVSMNSDWSRVTAIFTSFGRSG